MAGNVLTQILWFRPLFDYFRSFSISFFLCFYFYLAQRFTNAEKCLSGMQVKQAGDVAAIFDRFTILRLFALADLPREIL